MIRTDARLSRAQIIDLLTEARARTLLLVASLSPEDLQRQHDPLMSPIVWDLGHIAHFEEVWLLENLERGGDGSEGLRGFYDPFTNPRAVRGQMALPGLAETLSRMADVRRRVLDRLETLVLEAETPLLTDGYVFRMVLQHEYQHNETILQTLQLKQGEPYRAPRAIRPPDAPPRKPGMVRFPGGPVTIGTDDRSAAYDNERDGHLVILAPFWIDVDPVTCGEYLAFMEAGGYSRTEWWSPAGRRWLEETGERHPKFWMEEDGAWQVRYLDRVAPLDPRLPVCHVCYHEAEAYARWSGKRLPSEEEWEAAATWDPAAGERRLTPWGGPITVADANLDQLAFQPAPVGAYPRNRSPIGCAGMMGDVWEWTASDFLPYPGFDAFPYREYSEVFFGPEYKVLRGGSWATRPGAIRATFRNWDYPIRRQIFAGFRCARDD